MKINDMTDEQLSRWIAEKLEPKPHGFVIGMSGKSNASAWQYRSEFSGWQPRDFVNDPAMTVMLMEKIATSKWGWEIHLSSKINTVEHKESRKHSAGNLEGQSIERIIAEAFALANGYQDSGEITKNGVQK